MSGISPTAMVRRVGAAAGNRPLYIARMLKWIREARLDFRTGIVLLVLALLMWGVVTWVRIRDFVPEEFRQEESGTPVRTR